MPSRPARPGPWAALLALAGLLSVSLVAAGAGPVAAAPRPPEGPVALPTGIEALQPYVGQGTCDPVAKPGVRAFANLLLTTYPDSTSLGIVRDCGAGGQSEHKEGRAFDWGVSVKNPQQVAEVAAVTSWLLATDAAGHSAAMMRRLGIMYMIWNKRILKAYQLDKGWQPYSGESEHTDHVHFSFGWNGARKVTSFWDGTVAPLDFGPDGPPVVVPVASPSNLLVRARYDTTTLSMGAAAAAPTRIVQAALHVPVDGGYGAGTDTAVLAFQVRHNLPGTGDFGPAEWALLFPRPVGPFGELEPVSQALGSVTVRGWAASLDSDAAQRVSLSVDGGAPRTLTADGPRPDVQQGYPGVGGSTGFGTSLSLADGTHTVCATVVGASAPLPCRTVTVQHTPVGASQTLTTGAGTLVARGWALDPDTAAPLRVRVTVDGRTLVTGTADDARPGLASGYPAAGTAHGYALTAPLTTVAAGAHRLCLVAGNVGPGADVPLGCTTRTVRHTPFGGVNMVTPVPGALAVRGWATEPDASTPAAVRVTVDGVAVGSGAAGARRTDVAALYPEYGPDHGFTVTVPAPATEGAHRVCATGTNTGPGADATVGCLTVRVSHRPLGALTAVPAAAGRVSVSGWALDPDTAAPLTVHAYVDGVFAGALRAGLARSAVAAAYPAYGAGHGFDAPLPRPVAAGSHTVCVYALDAGTGTVNPQLGCRAVTVS